MVTRDLRFALDEKNIKVVAETLVGKVLNYWESDRQLRNGRVTAAEIQRDRYGRPFIQVQLEDITGDGASAGGAQIAATPDAASEALPPAD